MRWHSKSARTKGILEREPRYCRYNLPERSPDRWARLTCADHFRRHHDVRRASVPVPRVMSNIERCRLGYDQPSGEYIVDLLEGRLDQLERAQQELLRRLDDRPCCRPRRKGYRHRSLPARGCSAGPVAQWLEPAAHNGLVAGSSPAGPTNEISKLSGVISP